MCRSAVVGVVLAFVVAFAIGNIADTFVGVRTATGIGTRKDPGTLIQYVGGVEQTAAWYAVQKP